jgi:hypothetical protein
LLALVGAAPTAAAQNSRAAPALGTSQGQRADGANFRGEPASTDARRIADWVVSSGDNHDLPFTIIDKVNAKLFVFDHRGQLRGAAAALLGIGRGDDTAPGIGQRRLAMIRPNERTTPAGRFEASLGHDFEQDILWVDYKSALSLHRVVTGNPKDRRQQRLASATPLDNRISYGCINVPAEFYDKVIIPTFTGTIGIVYILPESKSVGEVFAIPSRAVSAQQFPASD